MRHLKVSPGNLIFIFVMFGVLLFIKVSLVSKVLFAFLFSHPGTEHMVLYMEINPEDLGLFPIADLSDNRDTSVIQSWEPPSKVFDKEWKEYSFREEVHYVSNS